MASYPQIGIRVSPGEKKNLEKRASEMGLTITEYVKYVLFPEVYKHYENKAEWEQKQLST